MSLEYFQYRSCSFTETETNRSEIVHSVEQRLKGHSTKQGEGKVADALYRLLTPPYKPREPQIIEWCLTYGSPTLKEKLLVSLEARPSNDPILKIIASYGRTKNILPSDHNCPDLQKVSLGPSNNRLLICFMGNAHKLNIPCQTFHFVAANFFDSIYYFRDLKKQHYTQGVGELCASIDGLAEYVGEESKPFKHVSILGTSSGGYPALSIADRIEADRTLLFSPPYEYNGQAMASPSDYLTPENCRIFFSRDSPLDSKLHKVWSNKNISGSISLLDSDDHSSLKYFFYPVLNTEMLSWLCGSSNFFDLAEDTWIQKFKKWASIR